MSNSSRLRVVSCPECGVLYRLDLDELEDAAAAEVASCSGDVPVAPLGIAQCPLCRLQRRVIDLERTLPFDIRGPGWVIPLSYVIP